MMGPGKYDAELTKALELAKAREGLLIILDGNWGPGFSAHLTGKALAVIPAMLRDVAQQIEHDIENRN